MNRDARAGCMIIVAGTFLAVGSLWAWGPSIGFVIFGIILLAIGLAELS